MKNFAFALSDADLLSSTKKLVQSERELTVKILWHLREVEKRMLYARCGFKSLYDYAITELGYSEAAAHRRIASMRLLKELPDLEEKLSSGALPLSTLAQAHSFFRTEGVKDANLKRDFIVKLENKSYREVQRELLTRSSMPEKHFPETLKAVSSTHHMMSILLNESTVKDLEELRSLLCSTRSFLSLQEVLHFAIKKALEMKRASPLKVQDTDSREKPLTSAPKVGQSPKSSQAAEITEEMAQALRNSIFIQPDVQTPRTLESENLASVRAKCSVRTRHIPAKIRRQVWSRDKACCTYRDTLSGRVCGSKTGLQIDHIIDFASGGEHTVENLRLQCRAHNTLAAVDRFGAKKMSRYVSSLR